MTIPITSSTINLASVAALRSLIGFRRNADRLPSGTLIGFPRIRSVPAILKFGLLWAIAFLLVGVAEELAFYLQYLLTTRIGFWPASVITCLFFGFAHRNNPGENLIGLANVALIGVFACVALRRTGSLWFPIGWHMAFDWGESFLYSVPDSGAQVSGHLFNTSVSGSSWLTGGMVGPEASLFNAVTTLIGIALLAFAYPTVKYPSTGAGGSS